MDFMELLVQIVVIVIVLIFALKFFKKITVNLGGSKLREVDPTSIGERLKKYLVKAGKLNPRTCKVIRLSRTKWSEGGPIAKVVGCLPTKNCTRFVIKKGLFSKKLLMYCPTDMHTTLHNKEVLIHGAGIDNAGGYYYPIPYSKATNEAIFEIVSAAFENDLRKMLTMDSLQLELEETYSGIAGDYREEDFYDEDEDIVEYEREMAE